MAKKIECTVTITEIDGRLSIIAQIPEGAEETIPGMMAKMMIEQANSIVGGVLGTTKVVEKVTTN